MAKLRISARPDSTGWIDLSFQGKSIGSIKAPLLGGHLMVVGDLRSFCLDNNIIPPMDRLIID